MFIRDVASLTSTMMLSIVLAQYYYNCYETVKIVYSSNATTAVLVVIVKLAGL